MIRCLLIAAAVGAAAATGRAGDFGDPLPLDKQVAAVRTEVRDLKADLQLIKERLGIPTVQAEGRFSPPAFNAVPTAGPVVSPFGSVAAQPVTGSWGYPTGYSTPSVSYTVGADPVFAMQGGACANGQCGVQTGYVPEVQRTGLFGRIFGRR